MRRAANLDRGQAAIVSALRQIGAQVTSLAALGDGVPDLMVSYRGTWYVMECKSPIGKRGGCNHDSQKLSKAQEKFKAEAQAPVHIPRSIDDALEAIGARARMRQEARS